MNKITIFGLAGTGTSTIGKLLAQRNNLNFLSSGDIFRNKAKENNLDLYEFSNLCKENPKFDKDLDKEVEKYGNNNDKFIVESRLAWHFIPNSFKIKLICDFNIRIKRICERDQVDLEYAKAKTILREESEKERYLNYYNIKDYSRDENFDLIIDTSQKDPIEICELIEIEMKKINT